MATKKTAVLSLEDLTKVDLEMINTDKRRFELKYHDESEILGMVHNTLLEIGCDPGMVYVEKEGVKYACDTIVLRHCYIKGRISEKECDKWIFADVNIVR